MPESSQIFRDGSFDCEFGSDCGFVEAGQGVPCLNGLKVTGKAPFYVTIRRLKFIMCCVNN